jgi:hypothetical protein
VRNWNQNKCIQYTDGPGYYVVVKRLYLTDPRTTHSLLGTIWHTSDERAFQLMAIGVFLIDKDNSTALHQSPVQYTCVGLSCVFLSVENSHALKLCLAGSTVLNISNIWVYTYNHCDLDHYSSSSFQVILYPGFSGYSFETGINDNSKTRESSLKLKLENKTETNGNTFLKKYMVSSRMQCHVV